MPRTFFKAAPLGLAVALASGSAFAADSISIFHHSDAESAILPDAGSGGFAHFLGTLAALRAGLGADSITVSSGDNFLPGTFFNSAVIDDALALTNYDAIAIGNHEFDLGPATLAGFITDAKANGNTAPFLSSNLDFSGEAALAPLVAAGDIAKSTIVTKNGVDYGIIGATTENLPFITSPGGVTTSDVVSAVQAEVTALQGAGVENIILISHLQGVSEDANLIPGLSGVDIVIAGGGDDLLENPAKPDVAELLPGDSSGGTYGFTVADATGKAVPVVATDGQYSYLGKLDITFNNDVGDTVTVNATSGPVRILHSDPGVTPDAAGAVIENDVSAAVAALASNVVAQTQVNLDLDSDTSRSRETPLGNFIADAFVSEAADRLSSFGVDDTRPLIGIQNGGGIRGDARDFFAAGENITELDTFNILPFANILSVVEGVTVEQLVDTLENAVSRVVNVGGAPERQGGGTGRFPQIAGFKIFYDLDAQALVLDNAGNLVTPGSRILTVELDDGTVLYDRDGGGILEPLLELNIATLSFTAGGGDQYFWSFDQVFTRLGITDQESFFNALKALPAGLLSALDYPEFGEGRITFTAVPVPAALPLLASALLGFAGMRRRT